MAARRNSKTNMALNDIATRVILPRNTLQDFYDSGKYSRGTSRHIE